MGFNFSDSRLAIQETVSGPSFNDGFQGAFQNVDLKTFEAEVEGWLYFRKSPRGPVMAREVCRGTRFLLERVSVRAGFQACFPAAGLLSAYLASFDLRIFP